VRESEGNHCIHHHGWMWQMRRCAATQRLAGSPR
jgi:hypothetical protein